MFKGARPSIPKDIPEEITGLGGIAQGCWSPNPQDRPSFPTVLERLTALTSREGGVPCRLGEPKRTLPSPRVGSAATYLRRIADKHLISPQNITMALTKALQATDYSDCIKDLHRVGVDPQGYIDGLDEVCSCSVMSLAALRSRALGYQAIDMLSPESDIHERCVRELSRVCGIYGLLPESHKVNSILTTGQRAVAYSGYSDMWRAMNKTGEYFAVKVFRANQGGPIQVKKVGHSARFPSRYLEISDVWNCRNTV